MKTALSRQASGEVQALAQSVPDSGGVIVVPAFTGLGAPYWKPDARGTITGLTRGTSVFLKLCVRAPRMLMVAAAVPGQGRCRQSESSRSWPTEERG
jgi:ribulose kinase